MDSPLISVILATYNGSRYIREAIVSVLSQDYSNLELIIIDDASTDKEVGKIVEIYKQQDHRIVSMRNEKNMERSWSKNF
jgi:glycosyltransferase involved in cell wall biosynthesis